jgi:hypothetical protein
MVARWVRASATQAVCEFLAPLQERRQAVEPGGVRRILSRGPAIANDVAGSTLHEVGTTMGMTYRHIASRETAACVTVEA